MTKQGDLVDKQRAHLKHGLAQCTHDERVLFVMMYGPAGCLTDDFLFNVDMIATHHMDNVVDKISHLKLDWAEKQVEKTIQNKRNGS